jgi:outer membrane protein OmpA-like peptidoglycan-associated protein
MRIAREFRGWARPGLALGFLAGCLAACSTTPKPLAVTTAPVLCADFNFPIYFEKGSDQLTGPARQEISFAASRVKGCKLGPVAVLGLADADGAARRNLILSRKRAVAVAQALAASGLPAPTFDIEALGEQGAVTPGGRPEPLRRRTEVVIRASAPDPGPDGKPKA